LSSHFWIKFVLALSMLIATVVFIDQYKRGILKTFRAKLLRKKLVFGLKSLLPVLSRELQTEGSDIFEVFRKRADLEALMKKSHLLFSEERVLVADFLAKLSILLAKHDGNQATNEGLYEVTLLGQRAILELTEIGY